MHPSTAECLQLFLDRQFMRESDPFTGPAPWDMLPGEQLTRHAVGREMSPAAAKMLLFWKELLETAKTVAASGADW